jgi:hypothetical protein
MVVFFVDLVLKLKCSSAKIFLLLCWIHIAFSNTLENEDRIDMGL